MTHEEIKSKIKSFWTDEKLGQEFEEKCDDYCTYGEDYGEDLEYESAYEYYTNHAMGGAVEYDLMEDMERWARENGIDCDEETLSDVTREIITEQPWCDPFVFRGRSSNSDYDKLKSSFDNLFDNKNNKYEMKHLKQFNESTSNVLTYQDILDLVNNNQVKLINDEDKSIIEYINRIVNFNSGRGVDILSKPLNPNNKSIFTIGDSYAVVMVDNKPSVIICEYELMNPFEFGDVVICPGHDSITCYNKVTGEHKTKYIR